MAGYVVNQNATAVSVDIVNRKGSLLRTVTIEANDYERLRPGEYYLTTYVNSVDSPETRTGQVLCDGTNYILIN